LQAPAGRKFLVKGFRVTRNTALTEAELLAPLSAFIGAELSLADLERAAELVTRRYHENDYFVARAYVPAQEMQDGIVEITVLEGKLERFTLKLSEEVRLLKHVIESTLKASVSEEEPIRMGKLERGLMLLNDIPGVEAQSVLLPGSKIGTSIVAVEVKEGPMFSGMVNADNFGGKFTGPYHLGTTLGLNDPSGYGDVLNLNATVSTGTSYARVAYQVPLGSAGLRLGGAYAESHYKLCCDFAALDARGKGQTATLNAQYPFIRSRAVNLYGTASYDIKTYFNSTIAGTSSDKKADAVGLGINGDSSDSAGNGGLNSFGVTYSTGRLDLDPWTPDRLTDAASANSHGSYGKTTFYLTRLQRIGETTSLYAGFSGQIASKNLDSSEKLSLGGPLGVRSYPAGEATGDEGLLLNLELRFDLQPAVQLVSFIDHGRIRLHKNEWTNWQGANVRISNRYGLGAFGLGLNWNQPGNFQIRASLAQSIASNLGRDANDNDSDGTKRLRRLWLQLVKFL